MDIRKLQRAIVDGLEDVKAQDIRVFNTEHLSPLFERVIVATGASNRQTKALAASVRDAVRSAGLQVLATEGAQNGEWIIVDCGAAVAHIMQPDIRTYYHLEEIWGGKVVKMKMGEGVARGLVKASEPEPEPDAKSAKPAKPANRKAVAKSAAGVAAAKPAVARKAAAKPAAAKPAAAKKPAAKPSAKPLGAKPVTAKKKSPARPAPASKTIVVHSGKARPAAKASAGRKAAPGKPASRRAAPGQPGSRPGKAAGGKPTPRRPAAKRG